MFNYSATRHKRVSISHL